jgi:acyl-CoA synthetase (NDP forming)
MSPFDPDSIAVVGASADLDRISGLPIRYLQQHEYPGEVYPVNPSHEEVGGLACYPSVSDLPEVPDLAMVILPARLVRETVAECFETGVETVLVVSSGFAETGAADAERELAALADEHDATLVGPNSQGLIGVPERVAASFTPALQREELQSGEVSFVSQSGAFGGALTTILQDAGVGLNHWVATGNEAQTGALDFLGEFADDGTTDVAAGYVEGFEDGRTLVELKRTPAGIDLPVVLLKVGRSERGRSAAASHTGTVAGSHRVYEGVFRELGVLSVDDIDEFVATLQTLTTLDALPGERLGVVTTSGGAGVHVADTAAEEGLELPALAPETRERVEERIPDFGSALNPVDITAQVVNDPEAFEAVLGAMRDDPGIDTLLVQLTNASGDRAVGYAERIVDQLGDADVPALVSWTGGIEKEDARAIYAEAGIPVFENPARCVRVVAAIARFAAARPRLEAASHLPARPGAFDSDGEYEPVGDATREPAPVLTEVAAKDLLASYGVGTPAEVLVTDPSAAHDAATEVGTPAVAKLVSPDLQHRGGAGAVRTDLGDADAVVDACEALFERAAELDVDLEGVAVQEQVEGTELALGLTDSDFGTVAMLGRGGRALEDVGDVTFRTVPVAPAQAEAMLDELETLDDGDLTGAGRAAVARAVRALSDCYLHNQWIEEADVNPLVVTDDGAVAVDALLVGPEER